ncbi:Murinoglobulin-1 [Microtus ochrogaster]|uniref:Murinoglobulin-1 n=1 Tax=Microtus ochrogaster TaxID=79684 RepID=A0A8J6H200_MICOH|nr:Murinoglobulin-1 [Microtus ochrogaster]
MWKGRKALQCLISVLLAYLTSASSLYGQPKYMALVPTRLYTETPEKICFHLYDLNETVTVRASLQFRSGSRSLFNELVVDKDLFHCVSFTLPRVSSSYERGYLSVHIKGPKHEFSKKNMMLVWNKVNAVFVQTDKPVYKPGQTVKFRVVSMDINLHPLSELDPKGNRIMQWRDVTTETGLKQLSFSLSSEPILGSYKIVILKQSGDKKEHSFTVEEFVLPRFEVQVKVPKAISIQDEKLNVTVCGMYTYGKPVPGHAKIQICYKYKEHIKNKETGCREIRSRLDSNGCTTQEGNISMFELKQRYYRVQHLQVDAKVIEEGTGFEFTGSRRTEIERTTTKLIFVKADSHFKYGIPFLVKVRLVDPKGDPVPNEQVFIKPQELGYTNVTTTDQHGLAKFSINITNVDIHSLTIKVYHREESPCHFFPCAAVEYAEAQHVAHSVYSYSWSYVHLETEAGGVLPCSQTETIRAHFILKGPVLRVLRELTFYYLVMAKGRIIRTGKHTHHTEPGESPVKGNFALEIPVELSMAPVAKILIYAILPDGEMIADSANFDIEKCLPNKVDLSFTPAQSLPASHAHLQVTASPQSLCGLRAVDQSVLLLRPEAELSPSLDIGLKAFTNLKIKPRTLCFERKYFHLLAAAPLAMYKSVAVPREPKHKAKLKNPPREDPPRKDPPREDPLTETIRKYFPETWIWDLVTVNSSGVADLEVTVPDTITEWKAGALCLSSDTGLGLSPVVSFRAFQPFFVELMMPYSVVRGEAFMLKATVLNYLQKCIRVGVLLEDSPDFTAVPVAKDQDSHCLCANGRHTTSWLVTPKSLGNMNFSVTAEARQSPEPCGSEVATVPETGRKDTVVKVLIVEPEGIKKEHTFSSLLCASDAGISEKVSLVLPPAVVKDSARAHFSVLGDILSSAIRNTQNLLRMPFGCGEQNMALFAPNIYVLKYLNETQQLTEKIKSEAIGYLSAGYQRQLNYKNKDGSYSAFWDRGGQGNTWLTAFVFKSFTQARAFIFIDETHITHAFTWLSKQQQDNGCFRSSGSLFNNAMKGGVEDEVTLSAYITIALLESSLKDTRPVVSKAMTCLETAWKTIEQGGNGSFVYTKALLAYAFALAGSQDKRNEILKSLDNEAIKEDNSIHWERPQKARKSKSYLYEPQAPSAEVEMNAYVLLTFLTAQPAPSPEDLTLATLIVRWLTKQQNSRGGFSSTQDTVVALHALSMYGAATFTRSQKTPLVTIQSSGTFSRKFQVENSNRLLLQQVSLPDIPGNYDINVSGEGCVHTQMTNQTLTFSFVIQQDIPVMNLQPAIVKVYDYYETGQTHMDRGAKFRTGTVVQPMALLDRSQALDLLKMFLPTPRLLLTSWSAEM